MSQKLHHKHSFLTFVFLTLVTTVWGQAPTIGSFSPGSGSVGTTVTINGTNFNTTLANNIVIFGATAATVTAATTTQLTVTVPVGATYSPITVLNTTTGLLAYSNSNFTPTFSPNKGSITAADFEAKVDFTTGVNPRCSASIGDLDGDGKADLAVANQGNGTVSVFRNTGSAGTISYAARVNFITGGNPWAVSIGDLDGDGKADLAVANRGSSTVSVLRNTGSPGTISYAPKVDFTTGTFPWSVAIGDLDGDGKADLAVTNDNDATVSVFRNTGSVGTISYAPKVDFTTGTFPYSVAIGDLDGDGKADLAVANQGPNTVSVFRNTSSVGIINAGSFAAKVDFTTGNNPYSVSIGDLDGDGKADLAVANLSSTTVSVFRNTGSAGTISYAAKVDFATGSNPYSVSIGDLDGDGKADLAVANQGPNTVSVFRNTGSVGTISYAAKVDFTTGTDPYSVSIGDLDGDGKADLAVANWGNATVSVIRNNPLFTTTITSFAPTSGPVGTTVTINGTNFDATPANNIVWFGGVRATVTAASVTSLTVTVPAGIESETVVRVLNTTSKLIGESRQVFNLTFPVKPLAVSNYSAIVNFTGLITNVSDAMAVGDLDGDGKPEVLVATDEASGGSLVLYRNTATLGIINASSFSTSVTLSSGRQTTGARMADFNGDGKLDIVVSMRNVAEVGILENLSSGVGDFTFGTMVVIPVPVGGGNMVTDVEVADIDSDGKMDFITTNRGNAALMVTVFRNTYSSGPIAAGSFTRNDLPGSTAQGEPLDVGDIDNDGIPDIVAATNGATINIFENNSTPGTIFISPFVTRTVSAGDSRSVAIADFDGDGLNDIAVATNTTLRIDFFRNTNTVPGTLSLSAAPVLTITGLAGVDPFLYVADVDGDNKKDLIYSSSTLFRIYRNTSSGVGNIAFAESIDIPRTGGLGASVAVADIDGDGLPDLSLANIASTNLGVARFATTTYYSRVSGSWNDPNTWSTACGGAAGTTVPTATDNVIICSGNTVTLTANAACNNLTINAGGTLNSAAFGITVNGNTQVDGIYLDDAAGGTNTFTGTLTVNSGGNFSVTAGTNNYLFRGNISNNGSGVINIGSDIDYTFNPVGTSLTITANGPFGSITRFSNGGGAGHVFKNVIIAPGSSNVDLLGDAANGLEITAGATLTNQKLTVGNHLQTALLRGPGTFINTNAALFYNATAAPMVTGGGTFTFGIGDFIGYNGLPGQNVLAGTYNNVRFTGTGSTKTLTGNIVVNGNLEITNGATLDVSASNFSIDCKGSNFIIFGAGSSFDARAGTVTFSGTSSQALTNDTGNTTFFNLIVNNTAVAPNNRVALAGTASNGNITVNNALTLTAGRVELGIKNLTYAGSEANLTRTTGWIETNGTGVLVRTGTPAASNNFYVGNATAMRNVILTTFSNPTSVRFTTTLAPTITNPTLAAGMWVLDGTGTSTITLQNVGTGPTVSSLIHRSNAGAVWTVLPTNAPTLPNFTTTNTITLAADQRFTVFTSTDYFTLGNATWNVNTNWSQDGVTPCGCNPAGITGANVRIGTGHTVTVANAADIGANNIVDVQGTGVFTLSNGNTNAIATLTTSAGSTINLSTGTLTLANPTTFNGTVTNSGGTIPATPALTFANGATYNHARNGGVIPTATWGATSTVNITGITTTTATGFGQIFGHLTINNTGQTTSLNMDGNMVLAGNFNLTSTGSGAFSAGTFNLTLPGNLTRTTGLFNQGTGTVTLNGTAAQTITGGFTFNNLVINNTNNISLGATTPIVVSNALSLTNGRVILGGNSLTYGGSEANLTRTNGWIETNGTGAFRRSVGGANFVFPVGNATQYQPVRIATSAANASVRFGTPTIAVPGGGAGSWFVDNGATPSDIALVNPQGTLNAASLIYVYNNPTPSIWNPLTTSFSSPNYSTTNYAFSGSPIEISLFTMPTYYSRATGNWDSNTTWSFTSGGAAVTAGDLPIPVGANVVVEGGFTVTANAAGQLSGKNITIGTPNGSGVLSLGTNFQGTVNSLSSTATNVSQAGTLRMAANIYPTVTTNTFVDNAFAVVDYNAAVGITINTGATFPNLLLSGSNTRTLTTGSITVKGQITVNAGVTFIASAGTTINVENGIQNNGIINFDATNQLNINTNAQAINNVSNNITLGSVTFNQNTTLNGNLLLAGSDWTNNATFTHTAGTVSFNGSSTAQSIGGTSPTTFLGLVINNSFSTPTVTLNSSITVSNNLALNNGRIVLGTNTLTYAGTEANLTRTNGWIETNSTGAFIRTGAAAASNNFYVGDATAMRNAVLATFSNPTSVRFTNTIAPTVTNPTLAAGMWVLSGTGSSNITLQNVGANPNATSRIQQSNAGASWTQIATNAPTPPNYSSTGAVTFGSDQRFTVFTIPTDYYSIGNADWATNGNWSNTDGGADCGCNPAGVINANVRIKPGHTVTYANAGDLGTNNTVDVQGTLQMNVKPTNAINLLQSTTGSGVLRMNTHLMPSVTTNTFVNSITTTILINVSNAAFQFIEFDVNSGFLTTAPYNLPNLTISGVSNVEASGNAVPTYFIKGQLTVESGARFHFPFARLTLDANASVDGILSVGNGASITVSASSVLTVNSGGFLRFDNNGITVSGTLTNNGSIGPLGGGGVLTINSGAVFNNAGTYNSSGGSHGTVLNGTFNMLPGGSATLSSGGFNHVVGATGVYNHQRDGGTIPAFTTWNAASNCNITGITSTAPTGFGQTFGNLTYNCPSQGAFIANIDANMSLNGNFTMTSSGLGSFGWSNFIIFFGGNVTRTSGNIVQATSTAVLNGTSAQTITGGFTFYNLEVNNSSGVSLALATPISVSNALTLSNGTIQINNNNLVYQGAEANLIRTNGWIFTNGSGAFVRSIAGSAFTFPVGSATQYQPLRLATSAANATVRFGSPTIAVPNAGAGSWFVDNGATTSTIILLNPQGTLNASSRIHRYNSPIAGQWNATTTNFASPNYGSVNAVTGTPAEFSIFTAATYYSRATGNWDDPNTWSFTSGGAAVTVGDLPIPLGSTVVIERGFTVTNNVNGQLNGMNITLGTANGAGTLDLGATTHGTVASLVGTNGNGTLRLSSGNLPTFTSGDFFAVATNTVSYQGGTYNIANRNYPTLEIGGSGVKQLTGGSIDVLGNLNIRGGAANFAPLATINFPNAGILPHLIQGDPGNQFSPDSLTINGNTTITNGFGVSFNGVITVAAGITLTNDSQFFQANATANIAGAGTFENRRVLNWYSNLTPSITTFDMTNAPNTVVYQTGTASLRNTTYDAIVLRDSRATTAGTIIANTLTFDNSGSPSSLNLANNTTINLNGNLVLTNTNGATIDFGTGSATIVVGGNLTASIVTSTIIHNATAGNTQLLELRGAINTLDVFTNTTTAGTSIVRYNLASPQGVFGSANYRNLEFVGGGNKTLSGAVTVSNLLSLGNNRITLGANNLTYGGIEANLTRTSGWIETDGAGAFVRTGTGTNFLYPVGSATQYQAVQITIPNNPSSVRFGAPTLAILGGGAGAWFVDNGATTSSITLLNPQGAGLTASSLVHTRAGAVWTSSGITTFFASPNYQATGALSGTPVEVVILSPLTLYSIASGSWIDGDAWSLSSGGLACGCTPNVGDNVIIEGGHTITQTANNQLNSINLTLGTAAGSGTIDVGLFTNGIIPLITTSATGAAQAGTIRLATGSPMTVTTNTFSSNAFATIDFYGGSFNIVNVFAGADYPNLVISAGFKTLAGATIVTRSLTVGSGATLNPDAQSLTVNGLTTLNGAFSDAITGGVGIFNGPITVNAGGSFILSSNDTYNFNNDISNAGTFTVGSGITSNFNKTVSPPLVITPTTAMTFGSGNGVHNILSDVTLANGATISFDAGVGQELLIASGATLLNNNQSGFNFSGNGQINGLGTLRQGTNAVLNHQSDRLMMIAGGIIDFGSQPNTVNYTRSGNQQITTTNYHNLVVSGTNTKTLQGSIAIAGNFTNNIGIAGFDANTQSVTFNGSTNPQTITGASNFHNIIINNTHSAPTISLNNPVTIANGLNLQNGRMVLANNDLTYQGTEANLTRTNGWVETNGNGVLVRTAIGANLTFPVGDATAHRTVTIANQTGTNSVNFIPAPITPGISGTLPAAGRWSLVITGSSNLTFSNVGGTADVSGRIFKDVTGWTQQTTNVALPDYTTTVAQTSGVFTIFTPTASTDYYTLANADWAVNSNNWSNDGITGCNCSPAGIANANVRIRTGDTVTVSANVDIGLNNIIDIQGTGVLNLPDGNGNAITSLTTSANSTINIGGGSLLLTNPTTFNGTLRNQGGIIPTVPALTFANGSTYQHAQDGGNIPTATWDINSLCLITGMTANVPIGMIQIFGNLTWNCPSQSAGFNTFTLTVRGNLTLQNSNGSLVGLNTVTLEGDLNNNIGLSFLPAGGSITFAGTALQRINGTTTFDNLTINNANNVVLIAGTSVTVSNSLSLANGRLQLGNGNLTYQGSEANLTRTNGWIETNGTGAFVRSLGGSNFTFPVGSATQYQPVRIAISAVNASVRYGSPSLAVPNGGAGAWFVNNGLTTSNLTLLNPQGTLSASSAVFKYNIPTAGQWNLLPTAFAASNYTATTALTGAPAEFAVYTGSNLPGIDIAQGGTSIATNSTYQVTGCFAAPTDLEFTLTIRNTGLLPLNISSSTLSTTDFVFVSPPPTTIAAGSSGTFTVRMAIAPIGSKTAQLTIVSDAANIPTFVVNLQGQAQLPATPSNLSVALSLNNGEQLNVAWADNSSNECSFELQRASGNSLDASFRTIATLANNSTNAIMQVNKDSTYFFRVRAVNGVGSSAWSNISGGVSFIPFSTITAVSDPMEAEWKVFPNPSTGVFNLQNEALPTQLISYQIFNNFGQLVSSQADLLLTDEGGLVLDLTTLPAGHYLLHLSHPSGKVLKGLVKE